MVIGYSAKHMLEEEGQLGLFGRLTVEAMAEHFQHDDYILYAPDTKNDTTCINNLLVHSSVHLKTPHSSGFGNDNSKAIVQATHRHGVQVFHGLATDIPEGLERNGIATVLTVGNLLHKHYPERYSWTERFFINRAFKKALKSVDAVVAMSEFSKSEIVDQYGVDPEKNQGDYACVRKGVYRISVRRGEEGAPPAIWLARTIHFGARYARRAQQYAEGG